MSTTIKAIPRMDLNTNVLGPAAWTPINPLGIPNTCFKLKVINGCNIDVELSLDGITAHDYVTFGHEMEVDGQSFHREPSEEASWRTGQIIYARAPFAGNGILRLVGYYV